MLARFSSSFCNYKSPTPFFFSAQHPLYRNARCLFICYDNRHSAHRKHARYYVPLEQSHNLNIIKKLQLIPLNTHNGTISRNFSLSSIHFDKEPLKPSSKLEATVQEIIKKKEELPTEQPKAVVKKSITKRVIDELVHYYHGFRLLFIDIRISSILVWRVLNGKSLTRREHRLLVRTVGDMFRLLPFSVFIIVPFMEFLLPVFIKFFPGMLPTTFQTAVEKEDKMKRSLKVKLEMAKFLQKTLDEMSVQHSDHFSQEAKEFKEWFNKVRTSGKSLHVA